MSRSLPIAVLAGLASAVFYLSPYSGFALTLALTFLAPVPLLACGLALGTGYAGAAAAVAAVALFAGVGPGQAGYYLLVSGIPALIIVATALTARTDAETGQPYWRPTGDIVGWLAGYGLLVLACVVLYFSGTEGGLDARAREAARAFLTQPPAAPPPEFLAMAEWAALYAPGGMIALSMLIALIDGVLAQNIVARSGKSLRPRPVYRELRLPKWLELALIGALLASFLPGMVGTLGRNAIPVLSTPFFLLGLAVIHTLSRRIAARGAMLATVYFLLALVIWLWAIVVLLGLAEQWASLRRRFSAPGGGTQEND